MNTKPSYTVIQNHLRMHRNLNIYSAMQSWMGCVMKRLRLPNKQARSPWTTVHVISNLTYYGKYIVCQNGEKWMYVCARSEEADNKISISLRNVYENRPTVRNSMKYSVFISFLIRLPNLLFSRLLVLTSGK